MVFVYIACGILFTAALLFGIWLLCLTSVRKGKGIEDYAGVPIAHRGLHNETRPENSLAAFSAAANAGFAMEFDLHLTADGVLMVHHDDHTARMCGEKLRICESTFAQLRELRLPDGSQIPTFEELLHTVNGATPLLIELKTDKGNAAALCAATMEALKDYSGAYLIESFDPRALIELKKIAPQVLRGQLCSDFLSSKGLSFPTALLLTSMVLNVSARPDFIAYDVAHKNALPLRILQKAGAPVFFWTVRSKEEADSCIAQGCTPIFEKFLP